MLPGTPSLRLVTTQYMWHSRIYIVFWRLAGQHFLYAGYESVLALSGDGGPCCSLVASSLSSQAGCRFGDQPLHVHPLFHKEVMGAGAYLNHPFLRVRKGEDRPVSRDEPGLAEDGDYVGDYVL